MKRTTTIHFALASAAFVLAVGVTIFVVREPMEALATEALQEARRRWREAGVTDYRLRYRMHGSVYDIGVRGGIVTEATVNGQVPRTANLSVYTVEGLFDTLELELDNLSDPRGPFTGSAHTVLMRVRFNAKLGFVERYLRSSSGRGRGVSIEMIDFVRTNSTP